LKVFDIISKDTSLRDKVARNTAHFRKRINEAGFTTLGDPNHPVVSFFTITTVVNSF
jgi:glycine C-acetyltransferase